MTYLLIICCARGETAAGVLALLQIGAPAPLELPRVLLLPVFPVKPEFPEPGVVPDAIVPKSGLVALVRSL